MNNSPLKFGIFARCKAVIALLVLWSVPAVCESAEDRVVSSDDAIALVDAWDGVSMPLYSLDKFLEFTEIGAKSLEKTRDPRHPEFLKKKAILLRAKRDLVGSDEAIVMASSLYPDHPGLAAMKHESLWHGNVNRENAYANLKRLRQSNPESADVAKCLAAVSYQSGDTTIAAYSATRALEINPYDQEACLILVSALHENLKPLKAIEISERSLALGTGIHRNVYTQLLRCRGCMLGECGRFKEAELCLKASRHDGHRSFGANYMLHRTLIESGRYREAELFLETLDQDEKAHPRISLLLVAHHVQNNRLKEAGETLSKVDRSVSVFEYDALVARILMMDEKYAEAFKVLGSSDVSLAAPDQRVNHAVMMLYLHKAYAVGEMSDEEIKKVCATLDLERVPQVERNCGLTMAFSVESKILSAVMKRSLDPKNKSVEINENNSGSRFIDEKQQAQLKSALSVLQQDDVSEMELVRVLRQNSPLGLRAPVLMFFDRDAE
jgi:tetratricopeptide (TPR) repeat protein